MMGKQGFSSCLPNLGTHMLRLISLSVKNPHTSTGMGISFIYPTRLISFSSWSVSK